MNDYVDREGMEIYLGDYVLATPKNHESDERGALMATARPGVALEIPKNIGQVIGRVNSLRVLDHEGARVFGAIKVTFMARPDGSLRTEEVLAGNCLVLMRANGDLLR